MLRLRLAANLVAMISVQLVSTVVMLVLAVSLVDRGTVWVAAAWGIGHAVGGLLGYLVTATVDPRFRTTRPAARDEAADRPHEKRRAHRRPRHPAGRCCGCSPSSFRSRGRSWSRRTPRPRATASRWRAHWWTGTPAAWCGCATAARCRTRCDALARRGLVLVPKASLRGLWAYLRAEAVLFTHGLYGSPQPAPQADREPLARRRAEGDHARSATAGALIAST